MVRPGQLLTFDAQPSGTVISRRYTFLNLGTFESKTWILKKGLSPVYKTLKKKKKKKKNWLGDKTTKQQQSKTKTKTAKPQGYRAFCHVTY